MWETFVEKAPYLASVLLVVIVFVRAWAKQEAARERESKRLDEFDLARVKELERIAAA